MILTPHQKVIATLAKVAQDDGLEHIARALDRVLCCGADTRYYDRECGARAGVALKCHHRLGLECGCGQQEQKRQWRLHCERQEQVQWSGEQSAWFVTLAIDWQIPDDETMLTAEGRRHIEQHTREGLRRLWAAWKGAIAAIKREYPGRILLWDAHAQIGDVGRRWHLHAVVRTEGPSGWLVDYDRLRSEAARKGRIAATYINVQKARSAGKAGAIYAARYAGRGVADALLDPTRPECSLACVWALASGLRKVHLSRRSRLPDGLKMPKKDQSCPWCESVDCTGHLEQMEELQRRLRRGKTGTPTTWEAPEWYWRRVDESEWDPANFRITWTGPEEVDDRVRRVLRARKKIAAEGHQVGDLVVVC